MCNKLMYSKGGATQSRHSSRNPITGKEMKKQVQGQFQSFTLVILSSLSKMRLQVHDIVTKVRLSSIILLVEGINR